MTRSSGRPLLGSKEVWSNTKDWKVNVERKELAAALEAAAKEAVRRREGRKLSLRRGSSKCGLSVKQLPKNSLCI